MEYTSFFLPVFLLLTTTITSIRAEWPPKNVVQWMPKDENFVAGADQSTGKEFVVVFPWNNGNANQHPSITLDLINPSERQANVTLRYNTAAVNGAVKGKNVARTLQIDPFKMARYTLEDGVANFCDGTGPLLSCPDTRVLVQSDEAITLLANDFFEYTPSAGDSFTVLPTSMAGDGYAFALPASNSDFSTIYFIPTLENVVNIRCSIWTTNDNNGSSTVHFNISINDGKLVAYRSRSELTIYATGDGPFLIVAAVRKLVEVDFGAFMPTPIGHKECGGKEVVEAGVAVEDYHPTGLLSAEYFYLTPSKPACCPLTATVSAFQNASVSRKVELQPKSNLQFLDPGELGKGAVTYSNSGILQMIAFGGYQLSPNNVFSGYGYLAEVPSVAQFVTGLTLFNVPTLNSYIQVIGDEEASRTALFDNDPKILQWIPSSSDARSDGSAPHSPESKISDSNNKFYIAMVVNPESGLHAIRSSGRYSVLIAGVHSFAQFAYAFTPTFNSGA